MSLEARSSIVSVAMLTIKLNQDEVGARDTLQA